MGKTGRCVCGLDCNFMSKIYLEDEEVFHYDIEDLQTSCCKCLGNKQAKDLSEFTICDACETSAGQHFCRMMDCLEPFDTRIFKKDPCLGFCTPCLIMVILGLMEIDDRQCHISKEMLTSAVKECLTSAVLNEEAFRAKYGLESRETNLLSNLLMQLRPNSDPEYFRGELVQWDTHPQFHKILNMSRDYRFYNRRIDFISNPTVPDYTFAIAIPEDSINSVVAVKKTSRLTPKDRQLLASTKPEDAWDLVHDPAVGWTQISWDEFADMGIYMKPTSD